jgi:hypothetical protein
MQNNTLSTTEIHKELDLIQEVIKRMANNSFQVKTWMITGLSAVAALKGELLFQASTPDNYNWAGLGLTLSMLVIIVGFWYLDAFFLRTEQLYRKLYQWVVTHRSETSAYLYDLNTFQRKVGENERNILAETKSIGELMFSKTLLVFFAIPLVPTLLLLVYHLKG